MVGFITFAKDQLGLVGWLSGCGAVVSLGDT
jgi:hypothetical protein